MLICSCSNDTGCVENFSNDTETNIIPAEPNKTTLYYSSFDDFYKELSNDELLAVAGGAKKPKPKFKIGDYVRFVRIRLDSPNRRPLRSGKITERYYSVPSKTWRYMVTLGKRSRLGDECELELDK